MKIRKLIIMAAIFCAVFHSRANNLMVTNVAIVAGPANNTAYIQFDIYWENSWYITNGPPDNWDAAWVFVKFNTGDMNWRHAYISTNISDHILASGAQGKVGITGTNGMALFIYRSAQGTGTNYWQQNKLLWNYGNQGVSSNAQISADVEAIEMVYVPQGPFYIGDGNANFGQFHGSQGSPAPYEITSENSVTNSPTATGALDSYVTPVSVISYGTSGGAPIYSNGVAIGAFGSSPPYGYTNTFFIDTYTPPLLISNAFPKGYNAFYVMKYECTYDQYNDYIAKVAHQVSSSGTTRAFYSNGHSGEPATLENYLDWAGLRPITEFEYEKACRGPLNPIPGEYAWGTVVIQNQRYAVTNNNAPNSSVISNYYTLGGNCWYPATYPASDQNPMRVGMFALSSYAPETSPREQSGAGYYGAMELAGNAAELCVSAQNDGVNPSPFDATPGSGGIQVPASWTNSYMIVRGDEGGLVQPATTSCRYSDRGSYSSGFTGGYLGYSIYYVNFQSGFTNIIFPYPVCSSIDGIRGGRTAP